MHTLKLFVIIVCQFCHNIFLYVIYTFGKGDIGISVVCRFYAQNGITDYGWNALFVGVVGPRDDIEYIFDIIRMGESDEDVKTVITFCDASGML